MILATYSEECGRGEKQDVIQMMINTNATAIIAANVFCTEGQMIDLETVKEFESEIFVGVAIKDFNRTLGLLEEARETIYDTSISVGERMEDISSSLSDAIILLKNENN